MLIAASDIPSHVCLTTGALLSQDEATGLLVELGSYRLFPENGAVLRAGVGDGEASVQDMEECLSLAYEYMPAVYGAGAVNLFCGQYSINVGAPLSFRLEANCVFKVRPGGIVDCRVSRKDEGVVMSSRSFAEWCGFETGVNIQPVRIRDGRIEQGFISSDITMDFWPGLMERVRDRMVGMLDDLLGDSKLVERPRRILLRRLRVVEKTLEHLGVDTCNS